MLFYVEPGSSFLPVLVGSLAERVQHEFSCGVAAALTLKVKLHDVPFLVDGNTAQPTMQAHVLGNRMTRIEHERDSGYSRVERGEGSEKRRRPRSKCHRRTRTRGRGNARNRKCSCGESSKIKFCSGGQQLVFGNTLRDRQNSSCWSICFGLGGRIKCRGDPNGGQSVRHTCHRFIENKRRMDKLQSSSHARFLNAKTHLVQRNCKDPRNFRVPLPRIIACLTDSHIATAPLESVSC